MKIYVIMAIILLLALGFSAQNSDPKPMLQTHAGSIKIISSFGGSLYLDGQFYQSLLSGSSALWNDIAVGEHTVELSNSRGKDSRKVMVDSGQLCTINFDEAAPQQESPKQSSKTEIKEQKFSLPDTPRLPLARNFPTNGKGALQLKSLISGDIYLGGAFLGSIKEGKVKKFSGLNAGDFSLELLHPFYAVRIEIRIHNKETTNITIAASEGKPYMRSMLYCMGGGFMMGTGFLDRSDDEKPRHDVEVPPFLISFTEVSQELWNSVRDFNPSARVGAKLPVTNVSWYEALEFCNELSRKDGLEPCYKIDKDFADNNNFGDLDTLRYYVSCDWNANGYRLPTEAEWEFAARSGNNTEQGSSLEEAWCAANSSNRVQEVATKQANKLGLFDMSGNVFEWCWDYWGAYPREAQTHPKGAKSGAYRIARGGSWMSEADPCASTARSGFAPHSSSKELGFRLVRNIRAD